MTGQIHEKLRLNGTSTTMACCPPLPTDNPRLVEVKCNKIRTDCWREYQGSWAIEDGKFFLVGISGKYKLSGREPIFANWFSGTIIIPEGNILEYVHGGFDAIYEQEKHVTIQNGLVTATITIDNRSLSPKKTN
ncbi:MAG: hypothetical protein ACRCSC_08820 [Lactococcus garvieae]